MPIDDDGRLRRALLVVSDGAETKVSFAFRLGQTVHGQSAIRAAPADPTVIRFGDQPLPRLASPFGGYRMFDDAGYQMLIEFRHALPVGLLPVSWTRI